MNLNLSYNSVSLNLRYGLLFGVECVFDCPGSRGAKYGFSQAEKFPRARTHHGWSGIHTH